MAVNYTQDPALLRTQSPEYYARVGSANAPVINAYNLTNPETPIAIPEPPIGYNPYTRSTGRIDDLVERRNAQGQRVNQQGEILPEPKMINPVVRRNAQGQMIDEQGNVVPEPKFSNLSYQNPDYASLVSMGNAEVMSYAKPSTEGLSPELAKLIEGSEPPPSQAGAYQESLQGAGITGKEQELATTQKAVKAGQAKLGAIQAQLAAIAGQTQVRQLQIGKEPISAGAIAGRNIEEERNLAIRAIPLQAQALAAQAEIASAQGDEEIAQNALNMAQQRLDTLFNLKMTDATNQYNYQKELRDRVYDYATKKEQQELDAQALEDERAYDEKQNAIKNANDFAKTLLKTDPETAAKISGIDWDSPTAQQEFNDLLSQVKEDPMTAIELAIKQQQLKTAQKEYDLLGKLSPKEEQKAKDEEKAKITTTQGQVETLKDKINLIDSILSRTSALSGRVGVNLLSRKLQVAWWKPWTWPADIIDQSVGGRAFAGEVHRLTSQEFLDKLIMSKAAGATFGQLSDREGDALKAAATQINDWEMKDDKGNGIGIWDIDETSFKNELNRIKNLANTAIMRAKGTLLDDKEKSLFDQLFNNQPASSWYQ